MIDNFKNLFERVEKKLSNFKDISTSKSSLSVTVSSLISPHLYNEKNNPLICAGTELAESYQDLIKTLSLNNKHNVEQVKKLNKKIEEAEQFTENAYQDLRNILTVLGSIQEISTSISSIHEKVEKLNRDIVNIEESLSIEYEKTIAGQLTSFYDEHERELLNRQAKHKEDIQRKIDNKFSTGRHRAQVLDSQIDKELEMESERIIKELNVKISENVNEYLIYGGFTSEGPTSQRSSKILSPDEKAMISKKLEEVELTVDNDDLDEFLGPEVNPVEATERTEQKENDEEEEEFNKEIKVLPVVEAPESEDVGF